MQSDDEIKAWIAQKVRDGVSVKSIRGELASKGIKGWSEPRIYAVTRAVFGGARAARKAHNPTDLAAFPASTGEVVEPDGTEPVETVGHARLEQPPEGAVGEGATIEDYDWLIAKSKQQMAKAEAVGNQATMAAWARLATQAVTAKIKAMPEPPKDPNKDQDYIAAAEKFEAKFHELLGAAIAEKSRV